MLIRSILFFCFFTGRILYGQSINEVNDDLLLNLLCGKDPQLDEVLNNPSKYQFQLHYVRVDEHNDKVNLTKRSLFEDQFYFYPASLIKLPLAFVCLEQLSQLKDSGVLMNSNITLNSCSCDKSSNSYVNNHKHPTFGQFLREMMIMSNNDAYNFFFDFVGTDLVNNRLRSLGYDGILLKKRFISNCSELTNRKYGGLTFNRGYNLQPYRVTCDSAIQFFEIDSSLPTKAGIKYLENGKIFYGPRDYSSTNYTRLFDLTRLLINLFYPGEAKSFDILPEYRDSFINAMGSFPRELQQSSYDVSKIPDYYYKFFLDPKKFDTKQNGLRIYNKVGLAMGYLSDVSYFIDKTNGIKFFISAAILAKKDDVINSGKYNYYDFGLPVLRKIGSILYDYENSLK